MKLSALVNLACLLLTFATASEVWATTENILLSDNFNDGNLDGWTVQYGNWYINPQGNLAGSNSGRMLGGRINTGNPDWDNYRIDLDMNGFQGVDGGVGFRYTPNGNSYQLDLKFGNGSIHTPNIPEATLKKIEDGNITILGDTKSVILRSQAWYHLTIEVSNENIKIWIHDDLIFDITDTGTKVKKGTLAFNYWTGNEWTAYMKFDNIVVTTLAPPSLSRLPVVFIPGIGGSEMKASQDIFWSKDDGHGGTYSHAYVGDEKIWVNQDKAAELGNDDYFDVLKLKPDGITSEADLSLTGNLTSFGYSDIDSFFTVMGYTKGTNFFVFPYDWRKDVRSTKDSLDALIETAKTASGQSKVNLVVHSMGGLIARYYISDAAKAVKVNKLIELGVPHLGSPWALKSLMYGSQMGPSYLFGLIALNPLEIKDVVQNLTSNFQLIPSGEYFSFYDNSHTDYPYPFRDDRDIDNNKIIGALNFAQTKNLLSNTGHNMAVFSIGEEFHSSTDPFFNQTNGTILYEIIGTAQPTLGQIHETWWITWPKNLIPKTDEIYINGDGTVPLYSASLKNNSQDISGATKIYYVEQKHSDLVSSSGTAMQTVKAILNDDNSVPVEVKNEKITLEGEQISLDDGELDLYDDQGLHCGLNDKGEIEENIPDVTCTTSGNTKHAFVKKKASKIKVKATRKSPATNSKTTTIRKRTYSQDKVSKTVIYKDIFINNTGKIEFDLDPSVDTVPSLTFYPDSSQTDSTTIDPTSTVAGDSALDQTSPNTTISISGTKDVSGVYDGPVTITLTGSDSGSGILRIEYSLDNGQTVQTYAGPFTISAPGKTTIQFKSIDNLGNDEIPQSLTIEIAVILIANSSGVGSDSPEVNGTGTTTSITNTTSPVIASEAKQSNNKIATSGRSIDPPRNDNANILGVTFKNPNHIADQINVTGLLEQQKKLTATKISTNPVTQTLGGLLIVSGGIVALASFGLITTFTFLKPTPK